MMADDRRAYVERAREEVERTVRETHESQHRALDRKYNLLRVSERRWRIVRVSSTAALLFGEADVITFECVTDPLPWDEVVKALKSKREPPTNA